MGNEYLNQNLPQLVELAMITRNFFRNLMADSDMSMPQFAALSMIAANKHLRMKELSAKLDQTTPATTLMVDKLISMGLVIRLTDDSDRRIIKLEVTKAGAQEMAKQNEYMQQKMRKFFGRLNAAELEQYIALHHKLLQIKG